MLKSKSRDTSAPACTSPLAPWEIYEHKKARYQMNCYTVDNMKADHQASPIFEPHKDTSVTKDIQVREMDT